MPADDDPDPRPTCFIAMPVTTREHEIGIYSNDEHHWTHVVESLFVPAVREAGFDPIIPKAKGAWLIHDMIVQQLETADLVLVDLSAHNPNVFFELGVRTSLNKPVALVWDKLSSLPFDTAGINTYGYDPTLAGWKLDEQRINLIEHIKDSAESCAGQNPLWQRFGLQAQAREPDPDGTPTDARLTLLEDELTSLRALLVASDPRRWDAPSVGIATLAGTSLTEAGLTRSVDHDRFQRAVEQDTTLLLGMNSSLDRLYEDDDADFAITFWSEPSKVVVASINRLAKQCGVKVRYSVNDPRELF